MRGIRILRLPTVVVVAARAVPVTIVIVICSAVVVVVPGTGATAAVTVALASFQDYCSRGCLRALFIFGLPVSMVLRNIRYEFSVDREEIVAPRRFGRTDVTFLRFSLRIS